ncbi:MAG TPA: preprotein translocase subunit SecE [bacterium]|nr:preprotein translocase subunit SecE [bacterium]HOL48134.1 preprotein translocase subunit SecE [bacterium]HPQ18542.1 preprotein translocase subunit SecE [bacterium]
MKEKIKKLISFLKEVWMEIHPKKGNVEWPDKDEIIGSTIAVLIAIGVSAFYVGFVDAIFTQILNYLIKFMK